MFGMSIMDFTHNTILRLESFHRKQLRHVCNIYYPETIFSKELYEKCNVERLGKDILFQRWQYLWKTLRKNPNINPTGNIIEHIYNTPLYNQNHRYNSILKVIQNDLDLIHKDEYSFNSLLDIARKKDNKEAYIAWNELINNIIKLFDQKYPIRQHEINPEKHPEKPNNSHQTRKRKKSAEPFSEQSNKVSISKMSMKRKNPDTEQENNKTKKTRQNDGNKLPNI